MRSMIKIRITLCWFFAYVSRFNWCSILLPGWFQHCELCHDSQGNDGNFLMALRSKLTQNKARGKKKRAEEKGRGRGKGEREREGEKTDDFVWIPVFVYPWNSFNLWQLSYTETNTRASKVVLVVKNPPANAGDIRDASSWVRKIPWRRAWQPTPGLLPGESHGKRSLVGYSPRGHKTSGMTEVTQEACMQTNTNHWGIVYIII